MEILYESQKISGTQEEIAIILRRDYWLTYREIGELIGVTREAVRLFLKKNNLDGRIKRPKIKKEISDNDGLTALDKRQEFLCSFLFGDQYQPSTNFESHLKTKIKLLTDKQQAWIKFYFDNSIDSREGKDFDRVQRYRARKKLKGLLTEPIEFYLEEDIVRSN